MAFDQSHLSATKGIKTRLRSKGKVGEFLLLDSVICLR